MKEPGTFSKPQDLGLGFKEERGSLQSKRLFQAQGEQKQKGPATKDKRQ